MYPNIYGTNQEGKLYTVEPPRSGHLPRPDMIFYEILTNIIYTSIGENIQHNKTQRGIGTGSEVKAIGGIYKDKRIKMDNVQTSESRNFVHLTGFACETKINYEIQHCSTGLSGSRMFYYGRSISNRYPEFSKSG